MLELHDWFWGIKDDARTARADAWVLRANARTARSDDRVLRADAEYLDLVPETARAYSAYSQRGTWYI